MDKRLSREEIARREVGQTEISERGARFLMGLFLTLILAVPLVQAVVDGGSSLWPGVSLSHPGKGASLWGRIDSANNEVLETIDRLESHLEEESFLRGLFLPPLQFLQTRYLGQGNEKVVVGRDNTLFYAPDVDHLTGQPFLDEAQLERRRQAHERWEDPRHPDPVAAIVDFARQLKERDIELLLLVVPVKPSIEPDRLSGRKVSPPLANRSWPEFRRRLAAAGVWLFAPRELLSQYATEHQQAYLTGDTHWEPGAMEEVAQRVAREIVKRYPDLGGRMELQRVSRHVSGPGDIARMLVLPPGVALTPEQRVMTEQVLTVHSEFWQPEKEAEILLMGDSFTNIYGVEGLGWGRGAGFAEQLSYQLQAPLDLLARNDNGAYVTRHMLATELKRGRDRLEGKRLVIWQFAERELSFGDWRKIEMELGQPSPSTFVTVAADQELQVTGVVAAISRSPRPGSVPYRDNIVTLHLVDLEAEDNNPLDGDQALVYGWGMRDNQLMELAGLRPGDRVSLRLSAWEDVEGEYGGYRRSPLDDAMLELELPNWGRLDEK